MKDVTDAEAINAWFRFPQKSIENFGDEGDMIRKYLLNPVLLTLLENVKGKSILDAGCDRGYFSRLLAKKEARVTGIEPAGALYSYAFGREQAEQPGITYLQADFSTWACIPNTFNYVIASMVFMDIPDYVSALLNCVPALKSFGLRIARLIVTMQKSSISYLFYEI